MLFNRYWYCISKNVCASFHTNIGATYNLATRAGRSPWGCWVHKKATILNMASLYRHHHVVAGRLFVRISGHLCSMLPLPMQLPSHFAQSIGTALFCICVLCWWHCCITPSRHITHTHIGLSHKEESFRPFWWRQPCTEGRITKQTSFVCDSFILSRRKVWKIKPPLDSSSSCSSSPFIICLFMHPYNPKAQAKINWDREGFLQKRQAELISDFLPLWSSRPIPTNYFTPNEKGG